MFIFPPLPTSNLSNDWIVQLDFAMVNNYAAFWTAATVVLASYFVYDYYRKNKDSPSEIEEVGESNLQLEQPGHPLLADALNQHLNRDERPEEGGRDIGAEWDNDDRARQALEELQARQAQDEHRVNAWKQKASVGTKKARSLERRDRRRAYFEYVRQEAERERERIQIEEDMFGDLVAEEREERRKRTEKARKELEESNRKRREREDEERAKRTKRRQEIKDTIQSKGIFKLKDDTDIDLADEMTNVFVLESGDYAVCLTTPVIESLASALKVKGSLTADEVSDTLTSLYS